MLLEIPNGCRMSAKRYLLVGLALLTTKMGNEFARAQKARALAANATLPRFEVAAIKPSNLGDGDHDWYDLRGRLKIENFTLRDIIRVAYDLKSDSQVVGGPRWIGRAHFDVVAKADDTETLKMQKMSRSQWVSTRTLMLQSLLADRFNLKISRGVRRLPIYTLVIARSGIKFHTSPPGRKGYHLSVRINHMTATAVSMNHLARFLGTQSEVGDRIVEDRTGLTGEYDFKMNWTHDDGDGIPPDAKYPGIFTALKEQLGLELKPEKSPVPVIVVESAAEPTFD